MVKPPASLMMSFFFKEFNQPCLSYLNVWVEVRLSELGKDGAVNREHDVSFIDRESKNVTIKLEIRAGRKEDDVLVQAALNYNKELHSFELLSRNGERQKLKEEVGKIELQLEIDKSRISGRTCSIKSFEACRHTENLTQVKT